MSAGNIDDVVDRLAGIVREATRAGDRLGYFASLYRQVTVEVRTAIHGGLFDDGARMDRFDTLGRPGSRSGVPAGAGPHGASRAELNDRARSPGAPDRAGGGDPALYSAVDRRQG
ncbi:DUF5995 family protein [Streptomyces sp. NPDC047453]|uniref:DUF5995 family protein n=1 Tax=Streptomyces sp. NPDC047453 TaxID=3154812 RepID=UPI0033C6B5A4